VFRGPASDEELNALPANSMIYVSGHEVRGSRSSTIWVRAVDAATAESAVRDAVSTPGVVSEATPLPYWISLAVPDEDVGAIEQALDARRARPGWVFASLVMKEPSDGFAELQFEVTAETDEAALRHGLEDYRQLRLDAGLAPHDSPAVSLQPPCLASNRSYGISCSSSARRTYSTAENAIWPLSSRKLPSRFSSPKSSATACRRLVTIWKRTIYHPCGQI
jgi:hypothetical protein